MKLFLPLLLAFVLCAPSQARSIDEVQSTFLEKKSQVEFARQASVETLNKGYLKRLSTLKRASQEVGKLAEIEEIEKEEQQILQANWPLLPLPGDAFSKLKSSREKYQKRRLEIEKESAATLVKLCESVSLYLEKRKVELTKAGELGEARKAKTFGEDILKLPELVAARSLGHQKESEEERVPVLRIRRFGDQLEVLVSNDLKGKISFASPITNVIEETYGKKELGETSAQTLGEFVGAKGYQVAPYHAYQAQFENAKSITGIQAAGLKIKAPVKHSSRKSLRLTLASDGKPPMLLIRNVLPNHTVRGHYQVHCTYFIPRENKHLTGFKLCQGEGAPIGGHHFKTLGQWTTKSLESATLNHHYHLALYPEFKSGKTAAEAEGEMIYLESLSVDQIVFSAFIHTRYDDAGNVSETFPNFRQQPPLVTNGNLVLK